MKIFFALLISLAYAAEYSNSDSDRSIEKTSSFRLDQLDSDAFYCIVAFFSAEEVLDFRFVSKGFYNRVKEIWPRMELSIVMRGVPHPRVGFSHTIKVNGIKESRDQPLFSYQAQPKYLRKFRLVNGIIHDLQAMINFLPKNSLTSLKLHIMGPTCPLISNIDFPKLTYLKLRSDIRLSHGIFNSLPNCMKVFEIIFVNMGDVTSSSLATGLKAMDKLEVLSLSCCTISKNGFFAILENLPTSLKSLDIDNIHITESDNILPNFGFKRLKEMKSLQKIWFYGWEDEFVHEIISNLPECITEVKCYMDAKALLAFQKRGKLINVRRIDFYRISHELFSGYLKIFPNLNEDIKKEFQ